MVLPLEVQTRHLATRNRAREACRRLPPEAEGHSAEFSVRECGVPQEYSEPRSPHRARSQPELPKPGSSGHSPCPNSNHQRIESLE